MKWCSAILFFGVIAGLTCTTQSSEDTDSVATSAASNQQVFTQEDDCLRAGGLCVAKESCPEEKVSKQGKCPTQSSLGAVCCHSLPESETLCQKLGGQCKESCPETLVIARANDCDNELKCCPLV